MTIGPWSAGEILTADALNDMTHGDGWIYVGDPGAPAFQNSWTNSGGTQPARFRRIGNMVFLQGMITGGSLNSVVFTLPTGYRPLARFSTVGLTQYATTGPASAGTAHTHNTNHGTFFLDVATNGNVGMLSAHVSNGYCGITCNFFVD